MNNLIRKKVILCLLDSGSKSADAVVNEIGQSLTTVDDQLTELVSDSICEEITQDEDCQYAIKKDVETFAQLVKEFLSNPEEHKQEIVKFITSEYYLTGIDCELVNHVISRFYLDSVYQTDEDKEVLQKILLASPSGLFFGLHQNTTSFYESWSHWNRLNPSAAAANKLLQILRASFTTPLFERLMADVKVYNSLYSKLQIRVAKIGFQVGLATVGDRYVEVMGERGYAFHRIAEDLRPGQWVSLADPLGLSDNGLAFLHLGELQIALENFNQALDSVPDASQRAIVLNNKGWALLQFKQYQKALRCFEEGIAFDSNGEIPELRQNKQVAEEYLAIANDADNLTEPTRIRFVQNMPVPFEETLFYEFKEIEGENPTRSVVKHANEFAVAFLNREGGRIFWGIRDNDRFTVGVILNEPQRNQIRTKVSEKLGAVQPSISFEDWHLKFHDVYDSQGAIVEDLWVIELVVPPPPERDVYYTSSSELFVKTEGGRQRLQGQQITEFILRRMQNDTETD